MIYKTKLFIKDIYLKFIKFAEKKSASENNNIFFLLSFPETSEYILDQLSERFSDKLIICYTKKSYKLAKKYKKKGITIYSLDNYVILLKKIVPKIKACSVILCDNYFAFLAGITFSKNTKVVQIWHANGAIKLFGLEANYSKKVSLQDQNRYKDVYKKFTHYVVSSTKMSAIFSKNFHEKINELDFGYPLTDLYFDNKWLLNSKQKFNAKFDESKKILLYVPTYRQDGSSIPIDFEKFSMNLGNEWLILVKAHPSDTKLQNRISKIDKIITDFNGMTLQELLPSVDCLMTDYSSVPFEYSLARKQGKIIFFCYDLEKYVDEVGIEKDFKNWIPGKLVTDYNNLSEAVLDLNSNDFVHFNNLWNEYVDGTSSKKLIEWLELEYEDRENIRSRS